jgi:hypothetical protein
MAWYPLYLMRMICATFHCAEMCPLCKTALNSRVRYIIPIMCNSLRIVAMMRRSLSGYLFGFRLLMASWTSPVLRWLISGSRWCYSSESCISSSTSDSYSEECWWKAFVKFSAKPCALSTLIPCYVLSNREGFLACFILLIAFHRE